MRLLLDTNIIVDVLSKREGFSDSLQVLRCCEAGRAEGILSVTTVTDVMYILRKYIDPSVVRETVQTLLALVDVVAVLKGDIAAAFLSEIKDFEDAVQASCAAREKADYIVTRNIRDFKKSPVQAVLPNVILTQLESI